MLGLSGPQSEVQVVQYEDTSSEKVYLLILSLFFLVLFADFSTCPCLFSSFVASHTNDVD